MGYIIRIGQAHFCQPDSEIPPNWHVDEIQISQAPANEFEWLNCWNKWEPSYGAWYGFCQRFNLSTEFNPPENQGYTVLRPDHHALIRSLLDRYSTEGRAESDYEYQMQRLVWLEWWINWALQNCPNPIMTFS